MKILHLINSLDRGGAEQMLVKLSKSDVFAEDKILIVTLLDAGALANKIEGYNRDVISLGLERNPASWLFLFRFAGIIKKFKPDVIQSWLYHSDLVAGICGKVLQVPVIWGLRQSNLSAEHNKFTTRLVIKACAFCSHFLPYQIIANSDEAKRVHRQIGYADKISIIPNGFSVDEFTSNPRAASELRSELGIPQKSLIVGMVGRFDSQKNHAGFFKAASIIQQNMPEVHFCLVGAGINATNQHLTKMIDTADISASHLHLLDARDDMPYLMAGFDVLGLPSSGESFPNVVGEAMASETVCVVTNVGDCAKIIGDTGKVVEVGGMKKFATEILNILSLSANARNQLGKDARLRIKAHYTIECSAQQFRETFVNILTQKQ
jgi:glycosyltransferase involved in cell wall biosynthesis